MPKIRITGFANRQSLPCNSSLVIDSLIFHGVDSVDACQVVHELMKEGVNVELDVTFGHDRPSSLSKFFSFEVLPSESVLPDNEALSFTAVGKEVGEHLRMYVLILDDVSPEYAVVAASHASIVCFWRYEEDEFMQAWKSGVIFTVICKVNRKIFDRAKEESDIVVITESKLDGREVALAFKPRPSWPKFLKFQPLWKP